MQGTLRALYCFMIMQAINLADKVMNMESETGQQLEAVMTQLYSLQQHQQAAHVQQQQHMQEQQVVKQHEGQQSQYALLLEQQRLLVEQLESISPQVKQLQANLMQMEEQQQQQQQLLAAEAHASQQQQQALLCERVDWLNGAVEDVQQALQVLEERLQPGTPDIASK